MRRVGLTGGIGSGKSFVADIFKKMGVPVYDSDKEAKQLMHNDPGLKAAIIALLGEKAYQKGHLNRSFVAEQVFGNEILLQQLNALVHPAVKNHFYEWEFKQNAPYVIQETALIFENKMQDRYDAVILVTAPEAIRIERVVERDQQAKEKVLERMQHQWKDSQKVGLADFVINNLTAQATEKQVKKIHETLLSEIEMA